VNITTPSFSLGSVSLNVTDLEKMKNFYSQVIDLDILSEDASQVSLGKNQTPLVVLHASDLSPAHHNQAGLYHFAILYASRSDLAKTVYRILQQKPQFFSGSADHLVSEAFYFIDPEGNGIELYFDRDRTQWQWENKQIKMATLYIDPLKYIDEHLVLETPQTEVKMGHFHLKVGDIAEAKKFYVQILGFDVTAELPGALFISVDGYHHHIGLNTWESRGASQRLPSLGLNSLEFLLPNQQELSAVKDRLASHQVEYSEKEGGLVINDPWGNQIKMNVL
jgi:catechol 2,3-dioxygenase